METLQRTANRGSLSTGYEIDNSLKFESDNSEYLSRTPASAGNRRTWTLSCWVKRTELSDSSSMMILSAGDTYLHFDSDKLKANFRSAGTNFFFGSNRVFRDTSAWYHIVLQCDTTQATNTDRAKLWVNGEAQTADWLDSYDNMALNYETLMNSTNEHEVGKYTNDETTFAELFNGYIAEMHLVDGTALTPTDFGETDEDSGIWKPKEYTGSYGTNGFYLDFEDSSDLGNDVSGNSNDFTPTNIAAADQATDTPTNNFCTFNPLIATSNAPTINEGAMHVAGGGGTWNNAYGSLGAKNGKWYYEYKVTSTEFGFFGASTFPNEADAATSSQFMYDQSFSIGYAAAHYYQRINGSQISNESTGWGTTSVNDIYGLFLNLDDQEFTVFRNGTQLSGTLSQPVSLNSAFDGKFVFPCNVQYEDDGGEFNFGGYTLISNSKSYNDANGYGNFVYEPKIGSTDYYAMCSKNLAEYG